MNEYNKEGKLHGLWGTYSSLGLLWYQAEFINGKRHGLYQEYYKSNGKLSRQSEYKYDKLNGPHEDYYPDGQLDSKGLYLNNQNIGLWLKYNSYFLKYDKLFYL